MLGDVMKDLTKGKFQVQECLGCKRAFDAASTPGIFRQPVQKQGFICRGCAKKLTAWEFYYDYLEV
jgi:hypothetical protein